ncbi:YjiH family protein [Dasania sp. GY-MA-18]|uniref:YjiH family protein n=1 Tax=Dasania phycosphaerae TaxID=2950436 RepID=A0A9J6RKZ2_9GAMM|nr:MULTISPECIES: YjiH family protein [Dasania]MCR8922636.1 YjiH family protein [Dasania sp. GY-MA-18]MCZ0865066.1 YjiH family protein [Dasania phycosphaerae]MCZ0868792.1 YjiH family protein [Dasania phycosphaerae]
MSLDNTSAANRNTTSTWQRYAKFLLPSFIGVLLFLTPITHEGKQTIVIGLLADTIRLGLGAALPLIVTLTFVLSGIMSSYVSLLKPRWINSFPLLSHVFTTTPLWLLLRGLGGLFCAMTYFQYGPEWIIGSDTGQVAYMEIAGVIFCIIAIANLLLSFLTDYGFLEFVGTIISRPFQLLFRLPGRAGLDAITSWVGDSSIGTILTIRQYESGHYSAREAATVATNFSAVSLPFCVVIAQMAKIDDVFVLFYCTVGLCGIAAALITPRLPPLSNLPQRFYQREQRAEEQVEPYPNIFVRATQTALARAQHGPSLKQILNQAGRSITDIFIAVLPAAMTIELIVLVIYHHSSLLQTLSAPMVYVLQMLQLPEAETAAAGTLIGFFDQFIPAIISTNVDSPITRFVLAGLSVTQLIYMAENGLLILRSSIPIGFKQLAMIFLIRTAIVLPILAAAAHMIYG